MSEFKLANDLSISVPEAKSLIDQYFQSFPDIKRVLEVLGRFGVQRGYIQTLYPFYRKRWFPKWEDDPARHQYHMDGIQYNPVLGEIERASKNQPIQGCSADIMKTAMILVRNYILDHHLQDQIQCVAQVHDQLTTVCREELADWWKEKLTQLMVEAGKLVVPSGLLQAETNISDRWSK